MLKLHSWIRIAVIVLVILTNLIVGIQAAARQSATLTFSGSVGTFLSNTIWIYVDTDSYTVYAAAGDTVTLDLAYSGTCGFASARLDVSIGTVVGSFDIPPTSGYGYFPFSGNQTFSQVMPTSDAVQLSITINSITLASIPSGCGFSYDMTVTGASLSPIASDDPIIAAEEAAGLDRVHDLSLPIIIYTPTATNDALFIDIRDLTGAPLLFISEDELLALSEFPIENTLIASNDLISVYKLTTGEYQVNVGPLADGKIHVVIFDGIPRTHTYGYTWDITNPAS